ncbi:MAG TPA: RluA family pseudouridine synthase [Clostridia bacterium]|nr:RluA family pseudouridine synthase [Clostridia bacterium]
MIHILYEDNHLLVAEKPQNMPVQADASADLDMLSALKAYVKEKYHKPGEVYLGLVHRLDRPVGGVMVFARTSKAAARLSGQISSRSAKKRYVAVVEGNPPASGELFNYIVRDETTGNAYIAREGEANAKPASLSFRTAAKKGGLALMDVSLHTGRHHQIRLQLSTFGFPIWGDQRYNKAARPGEQIALYAYSLTVEHPTKKEALTFTSLPSGGVWSRFQTELDGLANGLEIVYIDNCVIAVNKSAGVSVAMADGGQNTLEERLNAMYGKVFPVHRLDSATSGLVLFARSEQAKEALDLAMRGRTLEKYYVCRVKGTPEPREAVLTAYCVKDEENARVTVYDKPVKGAKEMVTAYRVLSCDGATSLLEVKLVTGRTHQIRAHMAHIGHPVLGDEKYGDFAFNRAQKASRLYLSAVRIVLHFEKASPLFCLDGKSLTVEPPFEHENYAP